MADGVRGLDRWLIAALAGRFHRLLDAVLLVKPDTVIRWHRSAWRLLWRWRSRSRPRHPPGRPGARRSSPPSWRSSATRSLRAPSPSTAPPASTGNMGNAGPRSSATTCTRHGPATSSSSSPQNSTSFTSSSCSLSAAAGSSTPVSPRIHSTAHRGGHQRCPAHPAPSHPRPRLHLRR